MLGRKLLNLEMSSNPKGTMIHFNYELKKLEIPQTHTEQRGVTSNPRSEIHGSVCHSEFNTANKQIIGS